MPAYTFNCFLDFVWITVFRAVQVPYAKVGTYTWVLCGRVITPPVIPQD